MTKKNDSSHIYLKLIQIMEELNCTLFEATSEYCTRNDIDPDEFVSTIDKYTLSRIQLSAVESRAIQKKHNPFKDSPSFNDFNFKP